jgi:hypothetical protein
MKKKPLIWAGSIFAFLVLVLAVHIYVVTRPKVISPYSRTMVRIDLHQPIVQADADTIYAWLVKQKGIDKAFVSIKSDKVFFLFFTTQNTGNAIVNAFKQDLPYKSAQRFLPTGTDYLSGCPVVPAALTARIGNWFREHF